MISFRSSWAKWQALSPFLPFLPSGRWEKGAIGRSAIWLSPCPTRYGGSWPPNGCGQRGKPLADATSAGYGALAPSLKLVLATLFSGARQSAKADLSYKYWTNPDWFFESVEKNCKRHLISVFYCSFQKSASSSFLALFFRIFFLKAKKCDILALSMLVTGVWT